ncbi:2OG-Fe(II) oxygenase family protein [Cognatilysobacter lacus]|uniref:2OG-Fe(II) oxygenase n=1 Tax=Cognatilysobacter lacus TaxID=1643323 RepID=A0A5D8YXQ0_9GAMM|nr:2OG-Fe(II) oxygenase [Lysobacter lacus]TZF87251.1 2OG-Fe(II) oxygenase [Lysobacter lacus]
MDALLDIERLDQAAGGHPATPFPLFVLDGMLPADGAASLGADFPHYRGAGFFPYDEQDCGPAVRAVVEQMTSPAFGDAVGRRLGIDGLGRTPTLATLCRSLNLRHGTIHTDSRSKIVTALLYLNETWPDTSAGCLRFLARIDDIEALVAPEVRPVYGTLAAFKRQENSFHGHLPFEGERRVIQVAWLTSEEEKLRKTRRGRFSRGLKRMLGALDKRFGAGRGENASHPR